MNWKELQEKSFLETKARQRAAAIVDEGTFTELIAPINRTSSPHLPVLGEAAAFDDGIVTGVGLVENRPVFVISQEGEFVGGAVGEVSGAKMVGILKTALKAYEKVIKKHPNDYEEFLPAVVISFETGGVRLQEANAGLLAHAEVMDLIQDTKGKIPVVSIIGSKVGCFGGMGFVAAATDAIIMSDVGRLGLTGPEVIEQEIGKAEFDSADRSLISRTTGGKHKYIMRDCNILVSDKIANFRKALKTLLALSYKELIKYRRIGSLELVKRQLALTTVIVDQHPSDSMDVWEYFGNRHPEKLPDLTVEEFLKEVKRVPEEVLL